MEEVVVIGNNAKGNITDISFVKKNKDKKYQRRGFSDFLLVIEDNTEMDQTPRENMLLSHVILLLQG